MEESSVNFVHENQSNIVDNRDLYFKSKIADCILFSEEGFEFSVHKELLYQTKFLREILQNLDCCCCKIEMFFPTLPKDELEIVIEFLYNGEIIYSDQNVVSKMFSNLTKLFGFPNCMSFKKIPIFSKNEMLNPSQSNKVAEGILNISDLIYVP